MIGNKWDELLAEEYPTKVIKMGIKDTFGTSGRAEELMKYFNITAKDIIEEVCVIKKHIKPIYNFKAE